MYDNVPYDVFETIFCNVMRGNDLLIFSGLAVADMNAPKLKIVPLRGKNNQSNREKKRSF